MTEDEIVGWHHRVDEHEFEKAPGDGEQGSLACYSQWGHKESEMTERLSTHTHTPYIYENNYTNIILVNIKLYIFIILRIGQCVSITA